MFKLSHANHRIKFLYDAKGKIVEEYRNTIEDTDSFIRKWGTAYTEARVFTDSLTPVKYRLPQKGVSLKFLIAFKDALEGKTLLDAQVWRDIEALKASAAVELEKLQIECREGASNTIQAAFAAIPEDIDRSALPIDTLNELLDTIEQRLNQIGVWRDKAPKPVEELPHLSDPDRKAREVIDVYISYREETGVNRPEAMAEFIRESAYSWVNRLFTLRCMEARSIIDEVILQKEVYGNRSLVHHRFARKNPEACAGEDDGLFAVLFSVFTERAKELPFVFDTYSPAVCLRPSVPAIKRCIALLSGTASGKN